MPGAVVDADEAPGCAQRASCGRSSVGRFRGVDLVTATLATATPGPYQLQAAIAAVHDEAARAEDTDWRQILGLYELLAALAPGPMVTLNRIVAVAMVRGSAIALQQLDVAGDDPALTGYHRLDNRAVRR